MDWKRLVDRDMTESKAWNWNKVTSDYWEKPAEEFIPILEGWKEKNFVSVLDLGCGIGRHTIALAKNGFKVVAHDLSFEAINFIKNKTKADALLIDFREGDMTELVFPNESFDCVLAYHTIQHSNLVGVRKVISLIHSILKKDGEAFITFASKNSDSWQNHPESHIDENTLIKDEEPEVNIPHTYLTAEQVQEILSDFKIIKMKEIIKYLPNKKLAHFYTLLKK